MHLVKAFFAISHLYGAYAVFPVRRIGEWQALHH